MGGRMYHAVDHPSPIIRDQSVEAKVLGKAVEYLPKYGFDPLCVTQAIRDLKYSESLESALTGSGGGQSLELQLLVHWLKTTRAQLKKEVLDPTLEFHLIKDEFARVAFLINKRLEYNRPIAHHLSAGLSHLVVPYNWTQSLEELHNLSDDIAFYAGDASNDFAWYTKRLGISTVYVSSELYMLQDHSADYHRTTKFVEAKVRELGTLGDAYNSVEQWGLFNGISLINLIKSQLVRG